MEVPYVNLKKNTSYSNRDILLVSSWVLMTCVLPWSGEYEVISGN